jgi:hypothetical protein
MLRAVMDTNEKFKTIGDDDPPRVSCATCHTRSRHVEGTPPAEPPKAVIPPAGTFFGGSVMERREFLKHTSAAAILGCFSASLARIERSRAGQQLERRSLGRTGERLSIIGFGGIVVMNATAPEASERVAHAIDRGVNYFDVAPSYGNAEEMLGPALAPYRKQVFLACKTQKRDRAGATEELERSLAHMRTDHFDLYQLHAVTTPADVDQILAPGGALEAFVAAQGREGAVPRLLGTLGDRSARVDGSVRVRHDPVSHQRRDLVRGELRAAGARGRTAEADGHPRAEVDGAAPLAGRRREDTSEVLVRAARDRGCGS